MCNWISYIWGKERKRSKGSLMAHWVRDLVWSLLWLGWQVQVQSPAWELLCAMGMAERKKGRKKGRKKKKRKKKEKKNFLRKALEKR